MNFWDVEPSEWEEMRGQHSTEVTAADDEEDSITRRERD
jgi:hypothetical protein